MFGNTKKSDFKFDLGSEVKDAITGFSGIVVTRSQWLHGCNTYGVKPTKLKDGIPQDSQWFDEPQLVVLAEKVHAPKRETGGPCAKVPETNR